MNNSKPLEGIKIVEISTIITASLATMMLADQGADVIKIESPNGDVTRQIGPARNIGTVSYTHLTLPTIYSV